MTLQERSLSAQFIFFLFLIFNFREGRPDAFVFSSSQRKQNFRFVIRKPYLATGFHKLWKITDQHGLHSTVTLRSLQDVQAGLPCGLGMQDISEKTCCPGNMHLLAWGSLQEAQTKSGWRQDGKENFG